MIIKHFDYIIIILALIFLTGSFFYTYSGSAGQSFVILKGEYDEWVYPLDSSETVNVQGPLGETSVKIQNGFAQIVSSPCTNQTCISTGAIHSNGQWAACLPNKIMLYIECRARSKNSINDKNDDTDVDATAW